MKGFSMFRVGVGPRAAVVVLSGVLALAAVLGVWFLAAGRAEAVSRGGVAYVDVAVATLWTQPNQARGDVDRHSLTNPVDINRWTSGMTLAQKDWLIGKTQTQALYGQRVRVLDTRSGWAKVAVIGQPTPKNRLGYPGWMPVSQLANGTRRFKLLERRRSFAQVDKRLALLYADRAARRVSHSVSHTTRLPVVRAFPHRVRVAVPGGRDKWLKRADVRIYRSARAIPNPTPARLANTARKFRGLDYLWAGTSGYGFDCSGFTHTVYKTHGTTIPRDAQDQARSGRYVSQGNLRSGDLVFFATGGAVHHVGIYVGRGRMIHAPNHSSEVEIVNINRSGWGGKYAGARRYR